jgi:hypothetical protein
MQQTSNNDDDALAAVLDGWLRAQPSLRAPDALHSQVMAAIECNERRRLRQGFRHWPPLARIAFMVLASVTAKLAVELSMPWLNAMSTLHVPRVPLGTTLVEAMLAVSQHLPQLWLYAGIALLVIVYGGLFGLGTAVYRTLYLQR